MRIKNLMGSHGFPTDAIILSTGYVVRYCVYDTDVEIYEIAMPRALTVAELGELADELHSLAAELAHPHGITKKT